MTLEYKTDSIAESRKVFENSCEQAVECEISLPDYCPDILRILKCTVTPCVISSKITGDRACADGNAFLRILYCDEDDNICSAEQTVPFSKYVETGADIDGSLFVSAKAEYVNCRAVSRRKVEIRGTIRFLFKICKTVSNEFISSVETDGVQIKGGSIEYCTASSYGCKLFPLSETAELPSDYQPVQRIVNTCAVPILSEAKIIKGKLLLKGEVNIRIIYCTDKNKGECTQFDYTIPVNQVIDADGINEDSFADVCLGVSSCDISSKEDSDGEQRFFEINLVLSAATAAYDKKKSEYISDAYSTEGSLDADYRELDFYNFSNRINETAVRTQVFDFSSVSAEKIQALWFGEPEIKPETASGKTLKGRIPVSFIVSDSDEKQVICEREFEFEYEIKGEGNFISAPGVVLSGYSLSPIANGKAEVKAEIIISGCIFSKRQEKIMISGKLNEKNEKVGSTGFVVYFPSDDEKLWDIARKYGTTEQAIKKENGISEEYTTKSEPLIVPCS